MIFIHVLPKKYSPIYVYNRQELFQSDVVFFTNKDMVEANNGYKYIFTTIDVFTKMAWVYPLKANTCRKIMECFRIYLKDVEQSLNVSIQIEDLK